MNRAKRRAAMRRSNELAAKSSATSQVNSTETETKFVSASVGFAEPESEPNSNISAARLAANRANAQLSHGPLSQAGKDRSKMNALKTGLTGRVVVLPSEDIAIYQQHLDRIFADLSPATDRERALVQNVSDTEWRLLRIVPLENALYARGREQFAQTNNSELAEAALLLEINLAFAKEFRNLYLQERRLRSQRKEDLAELKALQQDRLAKEKAEAEKRANEAQRAAKILNGARQHQIDYDWNDFGFVFTEAEFLAYQAKTRNYSLLTGTNLDLETFLNQYRKAA